MAFDFRGLIEPLAIHFLGPPNRTRSTAKELRYGSNGSVSIDKPKDAYFDHEGGSGGGCIEFVKWQAHLDDIAAMEWLKEKFPDRCDERDRKRERGNGEDKSETKLGRLVATYQYKDEAGKLLFEVLKYEPKNYRQRAADGTWKVRGIRMVPYRLPELREAIAQRQLIFLPEGEKDVDRLREEGCNATCNPGGAGKWRDDYSHYLAGAVDILIIADNDPQAQDAAGNLLWHEDGRPRLPGQDHAHAVAASLKPHVGRLRLLDLGKAWPECPPKGDTSKFFEAGKTLADLFQLIEALPAWEPEKPDATVQPIGSRTGSATAQKIPMTDNELATAFDEKHGSDTAYLFRTTDWLTFDGKQWINGGNGRVKHRIRRFLTDEIKPLTRKAKDRTHVDKNSTLNSVDKELQLRRQVPDNKFDANQWMLNTQTSTHDLKERTEHHHTLEDYLTRITKAGTSTKECKLWLDHIEFVTNGDLDFARYLQKLAGYALVGDRTEQIFAVIWGSGQNGKSDFIETIEWIMGDYAAKVDSDVFLTDVKGRAPKHELMPLRTARLVVASEIPANAQWNESRLKAITGGGKMRADEKYEKAIEFDVRALVVIDANEKPSFRNLDVAIKRRTHLIPFTSYLSEDDRDRQHREKLKAEADGILNWMIAGCYLWQAEGLYPPAAIEEASEAYFQDEDTIAQWLQERTIRRDNPDGPLLKVAFADWCSWCTEQKLSPGSQHSFSRRLKPKLGIPDHKPYPRVSKGNIAPGIELKDMLNP